MLLFAFHNDIIDVFFSVEKMTVGIRLWCFTSSSFFFLTFYRQGVVGVMDRSISIERFPPVKLALLPPDHKELTRTSFPHHKIDQGMFCPNIGRQFPLPLKMSCICILHGAIYSSNICSLFCRIILTHGIGKVLIDQ